MIKKLLLEEPKKKKNKNKRKMEKLLLLKISHTGWSIHACNCEERAIKFCIQELRGRNDGYANLLHVDGTISIDRLCS